MRLSLLFILPLLFTTWQTSFAATVDDCSKINTSDERLACFDSISKQNEPSVSADAKGNKQKSKWHFVTRRDEWDDSVSYINFLFTDEPIDTKESDSKYGQFLITCKNSSMAVFFSAKSYSTDTEDLLKSHGDYEFVRYRIDKEQAKTIEMKLIDTRIALYIGSSEQAISFIKEMFGHDKMLLEIDRSGRGLTTLEFSIKGIEEAIKPLRKACNW